MQEFWAHGQACEELEAQAMDLVSLGLASGNATATEDTEENVFDDALQKLGTFYGYSPFPTLDQPPLDSLLKEAESLSTSLGNLAESMPSSESEPAPKGTSSETPTSTASDPASESNSNPNPSALLTSHLPILKARKANLEMARELIEGARESWRVGKYLDEVEDRDDEDVDSDDEEDFEKEDAEKK